jgi:hypothetical protein
MLKKNLKKLIRHMILYEMIKRKNNMICLVHLDEILLVDDLDHILLNDLEVLKIFLVECDEVHDDDQLLLIWRIYFEDEHHDFEVDKVGEKLK